jgi:hypothetical protein
MRLDEQQKLRQTHEDEARAHAQPRRRPRSSHTSMRALPATQLARLCSEYYGLQRTSAELTEHIRAVNETQQELVRRVGNLIERAGSCLPASACRRSALLLCCYKWFALCAASQQDRLSDAERRFQQELREEERQMAVYRRSINDARPTVPLPFPALCER